jgi:hypothetical protein
VLVVRQQAGLQVVEEDNITLEQAEPGDLGEEGMEVPQNQQMQLLTRVVAEAVDGGVAMVILIQAMAVQGS